MIFQYFQRLFISPFSVIFSIGRLHPLCPCFSVKNNSLGLLSCMLKCMAMGKISPTRPYFIYEIQHHRFMINLHSAEQFMDICDAFMIHNQFGIIKGQTCLKTSSTKNHICSGQGHSQCVHGKFVTCLGIGNLGITYTGTNAAWNAIMLRHPGNGCTHHTPFRSPH